jgi:hypothetical protein
MSPLPRPRLNFIPVVKRECEHSSVTIGSGRLDSVSRHFGRQTESEAGIPYTDRGLHVMPQP